MLGWKRYKEDKNEKNKMCPHIDWIKGENAKNELYLKWQ